MATSMVTEKPTRRSLTHLLNKLEDAHKQDVTDYSSGYLNESRLYKPPRDIAGLSWDNARKPIPSSLTRSSASIGISKPTSKENAMKDTIKNFSFGTSGNVITPSKLKSDNKIRLGTKGPVKLERLVSVSSQGSYTRLDDGVLVENMGQADTMVKSAPLLRNKSTVSWSEYDYVNEEGYRQPFSQSNLKNQNLTKMKHKFIPSHINAVTKKDQYMKIRAFENDVLQKNDTLEQNIMAGVKAVEHLEVRLRSDLDNLQHHGYGPNFHRLQVYSNTFEDLIDDSPTFKYILGTIKKEYDDYISSLLDQQPSRHKLLQDQVEQLTDRGTSNLLLLTEEQTTLAQLQMQGNSLIEENEQIRRELEEERLLHEDLPEEEEEVLGTVALKEPDLELADKIEEAHAAILEKLDQIKELRQTLRREFVPSSVVTHLEQCIKETEVESQRYQSQKDFFKRSCDETEKDLRDTIEHADTTEKDAKRIWKQVHKREGEQESDNGEEEAKWNWYIS